MALKGVGLIFYDKYKAIQIDLNKKRNNSSVKRLHENLSQHFQNYCKYTYETNKLYSNYDINHYDD